MDVSMYQTVYLFGFLPLWLRRQGSNPHLGDPFLRGIDILKTNTGEICMTLQNDLLALFRIEKIEPPPPPSFLRPLLGLDSYISTVDALHLLLLFYGVHEFFSRYNHPPITPIYSTKLVVSQRRWKLGRVSGRFGFPRALHQADQEVMKDNVPADANLSDVSVRKKNGAGNERTWARFKDVNLGPWNHCFHQKKFRSGIETGEIRHQIATATPHRSPGSILNRRETYFV